MISKQSKQDRDHLLNELWATQANWEISDNFEETKQNMNVIKNLILRLSNGVCFNLNLILPIIFPITVNTPLYCVCINDFLTW